MQSDFLLALVRAIARRRNAEAGQPPLKVILMSATMDATLFSAYLGGCKILSAPGRTFPVKQFHLEHIYEMTGYQLAPDSRCCLRYHGAGARARSVPIEDAESDAVEIQVPPHCTGTHTATYSSHSRVPSKHHVLRAK